jgi:ubiquitin C-terminal hydrolase
VKNITTIKKPSVKNLEITKYDFAAKKSIYKYDLVSAVLHVGKQTNGGHYYSIAKRQSEENRNNSEWYVLNDTNVTPLTGTKIYANDGVSSLNLTTIDDCVKSNIFLSQVMLLFYQRQI